MKTSVVAGLYAEVPADAAPPSTRRLATRALRRSPDGNGIRLRWFRSVVGNNPISLRRAFSSLLAEDGLAFVASDTLAGRVLLADPLTVWLNADTPIDAVAAVVAHEVEHTRILALCGPPGSDAERDAHEFAAELAADSVICRAALARGYAGRNLWDAPHAIPRPVRRVCFVASVEAVRS